MITIATYTDLLQNLFISVQVCGVFVKFLKESTKWNKNYCCYKIFTTLNIDLNPSCFRLYQSFFHHTANLTPQNLKNVRRRSFPFSLHMKNFISLFEIYCSRKNSRILYYYYSRIVRVSSSNSIILVTTKKPKTRNETINNHPQATASDSDQMKNGIPIAC